MFIPCFSLFSVLEMRRRPDIYGRFKELFRVLPCMLMKSHEQLLEEEVRCYPDPSGIDPTLLAFSVLGGEGMDLARVLDKASDDEFFRGKEEHWNDGAQQIVEGIASLVANFPPDGDSYTRDEVRHFVEITGFSQVAMRQNAFAKETIEMNRAVSIDAFPSVKATTYAVWHKFYADQDRKWTRSDAFDIIIASAIPYVDAIVTESHLAEGLRKTKRLDGFIKHLTIHTLRDFRLAAPEMLLGNSASTSSSSEGGTIRSQ
jgi:hypothetical protein